MWFSCRFLCYISAREVLMCDSAYQQKGQAVPKNLRGRRNNEEKHLNLKGQ